LLPPVIISVSIRPGIYARDTQPLPQPQGRPGRHEAIRPTDVKRTPDSIKADLTRDQYRLYSLIWKRFVSSQMTPERSEILTISITAGEYEFRASAGKVLFEGFTAIDRDERGKKSTLPDVREGDSLTCREFLPEQHFTSPPPRYKMPRWSSFSKNPASAGHRPTRRR
jgi:DNA topoisomerase-1